MRLEVELGRTAATAGRVEADVPGDMVTAQGSLMCVGDICSDHHEVPFAFTEDTCSFACTDGEFCD
jgi:hypothetical protein